jgi:hypothetical protein
VAYLNKNRIETPVFFDTADEFLQFLYDLNVVGFIEDAADESFFRWCYRERNYSNPNPRVRTEVRYLIHYGLSKGLNTGKKIMQPPR